MSNLVRQNQGQLNIELFKKPTLNFYGEDLNFDQIKSDLSGSQIQFIEAINYELIRVIPNEELIDLVFIVVSNNLRAFGSKMKAEDQVLLTNDFVFELKNEFSNLTIKEFEQIIYNGIRNKYDTDTAGISIVNFNIWAKKYLDHKMKMNQELKKIIDRHDRNRIDFKDPVEIKLDDVMNIIRVQYKLIKNQYDELVKRSNKKLISFDEYWIRNGLEIPANYLFSQFQKFNLIKPVDIDNLRKNHHREMPDEISSEIKNWETKRILLCEIVLRMRNEKKGSSN